jgi:hypothetical protein
MSASHTTTLSFVHSIFLSLQNHLRNQLDCLPTSGVPQRLIDGLVAAHSKLSDYFMLIDKSPYYTWAASKCCSVAWPLKMLIFFSQVLDPRINVAGLLASYTRDEDWLLRDDVERRKNELIAHFGKHYYRTPTSDSTSASRTVYSGSTGAVPTLAANPLFAGFQQTFPALSTTGFRAEIDLYFARPREPMGTDPLRWWSSQTQLPNLARLARDIFSIPGAHSSVLKL